MYYLQRQEEEEENFYGPRSFYYDNFGNWEGVVEEMEPTTERNNSEDITEERNNSEETEERKNTEEALTYAEEKKSNFYEMERNWTKEFYNILSLPSSNLLDKYRLLRELSQDFLHTAEQIGKIIISEFNLPNNYHKLLTPVSIGGIAGGLKYIKKGILFKFATDVQISSNKYLYGGIQPSHEAAQKAAGHELKGLTICFSYLQLLKIPIQTPLCCLIDYLGHRLTAVSLLPVSRKTLIYGSSDGGVTVLDSDPTFTSYCQHLFKSINLQPHLVRNVTMHGPGDIEGHKGEDSTYYLLDFARLLPPEIPSTEYSTDVLFKILRKELVVKHDTPLCSDAFTGWGRGDPNFSIHCDNVIKATTNLYEIIIPSFAKELNDIPINKDLKQVFLTDLIHKQGINVRHLGIVLKHITNDSWKFIIKTEMAARIIKRQIWALLKSLVLLSTSEQPYINAIIEYLHNIFFIDPITFTTPFWAKDIKEHIKNKFEIIKAGLKITDFFTMEELNERYDFHQSVWLQFLFQRLEEMMGLKISERYLSTIPSPSKQKELTNEGANPVSLIGKLNPMDIPQLPIVNKHIPYVSLALGATLVNQIWKEELFAMSSQTHLLKPQTNPLLEIATNHIQTALRAIPHLADLHFKLGQTYHLQGWKVLDESQAISLWLKAEQCFLQCIQFNAEHHEALMLLGFVYIQLGKLQEAHTLLCKALKLEPSISSIYIPAAKRIVDFWHLTSCPRGNPLMAKSMAEALIEVYPYLGDAYYWLAKLYILYFDESNGAQDSRRKLPLEKSDIIKMAANNLSLALEISESYLDNFLKECYYFSNNELSFSLGSLFVLANCNEKIATLLMQSDIQHIKELSLKYLVRWKASLKDLGDWGRFVPNLQTIQFQDTITLSAQTLITISTNCKNLQSVSFHRVWLENNDAFIQFFKMCPQLREINLGDLSSCEWSMEFSEILGACNLTKLALISIGTVTTEHLEILLQKNQGKLLELEIQSCYLVEDILPQIASFCPQLQSLKLSGHDIPDNNFNTLASSCCHLTSLWLSCPKMGNNLVHSMKGKFPHLKSLHLEGMDQLDGSGIEMLGEIGFLSLKEFSVREINCMQEEKAMLDLSRGLKNLEKLTIHMCGYMRSPSIANHVAQFKTLKELILLWNGGFWLDDDGLGTIVQECKALTNLDLSCNITEKGLEHILFNCANLTALQFREKVSARNVRPSWTDLFVSDKCLVKYKDEHHVGLKHFAIFEWPFTLSSVLDIVTSQPNLEELNLKRVFCSEPALISISKLTHLKNLTITLSQHQNSHVLVPIVSSCKELVQLEICTTLTKRDFYFLFKKLKEEGNPNLYICIGNM